MIGDTPRDVQAAHAAGVRAGACGQGAGRLGRRAG
ncbi:HAD family hydrolase [Streptomonospora halotolerans]|nr:HAD family hydrolase [Streptomonospora nanhaiensis]